MESYTYTIAALLACHNRREKTLSCLHSLFEVSLPETAKVDIFLVNDGSTDGTGEAVKIQFPGVRVIEGDGNLYWNRGMNLAWHAASETFPYDYYLWLNDDVILDKNSVITLLKDIQGLEDSDAIIVGACRSGKGGVTYSGYNNLKENIKLKPEGVIQKCEYFNGNVVLVPSAVSDQVGFLDPIYHHAQGDFDYGLRAKKSGIYSFVSSGFVGVCELNRELPRWCNPHYSFFERLKSFYSPLGGRPRLTFIFQRKYIGFATALFHYLTIHLRLIFPGLWSKRWNKTVTEEG